jgi:hypothetical protein
VRGDHLRQTRLQFAHASPPFESSLFDTRAIPVPGAAEGI